MRMSGHQYESCRKPSWFLWRWRNRPWLCTCGKAWRTVVERDHAGGWREWVEWKPGDPA
jgi:hypothetical protein